MCDTGKLYRDASILEMRKKQVNRLEQENQRLYEALASMYEDCRDGPAGNDSMRKAREALGLPVIQPSR